MPAVGDLDARRHRFVVVIAARGRKPAPGVTFAEQERGEGVLVDGGVQQGTLLLDTREGYSLVAVDPEARIDDPHGGIWRVAERPGDVVE